MTKGIKRARNISMETMKYAQSINEMNLETFYDLGMDEKILSDTISNRV
jgi:hypothetical protein